eukprot:10712638-Karenia_brevis.AAC.1
MDAADKAAGGAKPSVATSTQTKLSVKPDAEEKVIAFPIEYEEEMALLSALLEVQPFTAPVQAWLPTKCVFGATLLNGEATQRALPCTHIQHYRFLGM